MERPPKSIFGPALLALAGGVSAQEASVACTATNARLNLSRDLKAGIDYVPIVDDDSLGIHVAYSVKSDSSLTVGIFLLPLRNNEVLLFGAGYAENSLEGKQKEAERVDHAIRGCMGGGPDRTMLRLVAPHGHLDHINPPFVTEMEALGYGFAEITYHEEDRPWVEPMKWSESQRALMNQLRGSTCGSKLASYESPLGEIWFTPRPGHTDGSIDLILDLQGDPTNRLLIRGSVAGGQCPHVPGIEVGLDAHGTVILSERVQVRARVEILNGDGSNPLCLMTDATPRLGGRWQATVDVAGHPGASGVVLAAYEGGLTSGPQTPYGQWLLDSRSPQLMVLAQPARTPSFTVDVPAAMDFLGFEAYFQGLIVGGGHELCNALHVQIGI